MRLGRQALRVEELAGAVQHDRQHRHCDLTGYRRTDRAFVEVRTARARHDHKMLRRIEAVQPQVTLDGIGIRWECGLLDQDFRAPARGPEERREKLMQVDTRRACNERFMRVRTYERRCGKRAKLLGQVIPGMRAAQPSVDAKRFPRFERLAESALSAGFDRRPSELPSM